MSDLSVKTNAAGTMAASFTIGKRGPTIRQGEFDPNSPTILDGISGDLFVRKGTAPKLYQFKNTSWIDLTPDVIQRSTTGSTNYTMDASQTYLGVRAPGNVTVTLPAGSMNRKIIVKDEVGRQDGEVITVTAAGRSQVFGDFRNS